MDAEVIQLAERFIRGKHRDEEMTIGPSLDAIDHFPLMTYTLLLVFLIRSKR